MNSESIAKKLKDLRRSFKFTQAEVASSIGLHRLTYANLEKGNVDFVNSHLLKLAELYGTSYFSILAAGLTESDYAGNILQDGDSLSYGLSEAAKREMAALNATISERRKQNEFLEAQLESNNARIDLQNELLSLYRKQLPKLGE